MIISMDQPKIPKTFAVHMEVKSTKTARGKRGEEGGGGLFLVKFPGCGK